MVLIVSAMLFVIRLEPGFGYVGWWDLAAGILAMNRETEMGKRKGKRDMKVHNFIKWLMAHITSIGIGVFLITCCLVVVTISVMAIYAWIGRKTIKISFDEGWPPSVEVTPDKSKEEVVQLSVASRRDSEKLVIPIDLLPEGLQGSRDEVLLRITTLWQAGEKQRDSIWQCCYTISMEIALHGSIDTNVRADDDHTKEVYRAIEIFLNAIGYYDGQLDGDQGRTKAALDRFQNEKGLGVDSKLGRKTFRAMVIMLGKISRDGESDELGYCWVW